jgi:hypothetical protein
MGVMSTQANLDVIRERTGDELDRAVGRFISTLDANELGAAMIEVLTFEHERAASVGRRRMGDEHIFSDDDRDLADRVMEGERVFVDAFMADIAAGRYWDVKLERIDFAGIYKRAQMYLARLAGTANEAYVKASGDGETWTWILDPKAEHCESESGECLDCPGLAAGSPYTSETLPTFPGAGDTKCLLGCRCAIVRSDGRAGFKPWGWG